MSVPDSEQLIKIAVILETTVSEQDFFCFGQKRATEGRIEKNFKNFKFLRIIVEFFGF